MGYHLTALHKRRLSDSIKKTKAERRIPDTVRFWNRVDKGGDAEACWVWIGATRNWRGYGAFPLTHTKTVNAHRMAWILTNGEIAEGLCVCHKCDNPSCVNPKHLFLGSYKDNSQDMVSKGRSSRGEKNKGGGKLSQSDVLQIRELWSRKSTKQLALRYGVSKSMVLLIKNRKKWAWL